MEVVGGGHSQKKHSSVGRKGRWEEGYKNEYLGEREPVGWKGSFEMCKYL